MRRQVPSWTESGHQTEYGSHRRKGNPCDNNNNWNNILPLEENQRMKHQRLAQDEGMTARTCISIFFGGVIWKNRNCLTARTRKDTNLCQSASLPVCNHVFYIVRPDKSHNGQYRAGEPGLLSPFFTLRWSAHLGKRRSCGPPVAPLGKYVCPFWPYLSVRRSVNPFPQTFPRHLHTHGCGLDVPGGGCCQMLWQLI